MRKAVVSFVLVGAVLAACIGCGESAPQGGAQAGGAAKALTPPGKAADASGGAVGKPSTE